MSNLMKSIALIVCLSVSYETQAQKITNVQPDEARVGQSLTVTITGQNVDFSQASTSARLIMTKNGSTQMGIPAQNLSPISSTKLQADFVFLNLYDTGLYDIEYRDFSGSPIIKKNGFRLKADSNPPGLKTIEPDRGKAGNNVQVTIKSKNFTFSQSTGNKRILMGKNGNYSEQFTSIIRVSDNKSRATLALDSTLEGGFYDFAYYNSSNYVFAEREKGFFVETDNFKLPQIKNVKEDTVNKGRKNEVNVSLTSGNLYDNPTDTMYLKKGNNLIPANRVAIYDPKKLEATFSPGSQAETGLYSVVLKYAGNFELLQKDAVYMAKGTGSNVDGVDKKKVQVKTYPNPVEQDLTIQIGLDKPMNIRGRLLNASGKVTQNLFSRDFNAGKNVIKEISLKSLPNGVYFLELASTEGEPFKQMIPIQKQ